MNGVTRTGYMWCPEVPSSTKHLGKRTRAHTTAQNIQRMNFLEFVAAVWRRKAREGKS